MDQHFEAIHADNFPKPSKLYIIRPANLPKIVISVFYQIFATNQSTLRRNCTANLPKDA